MAVGLAGAALVGAGAGGAAAGPKDNGKGNNGNGGPPSAAPVLANGVASVTNGTVTATVTPDLANVGDSAQVLQVGSAPIDSAGNFTLTANPGVDAMASAIAHALADNNGWVNLDLTETGANGETAVQSISRQFVAGSGQPVSSAAIQAGGAGASTLGHWVGEEGSDGSTSVGAANAVVQSASPGAASAISPSYTALGGAVSPAVGCVLNSSLYSQGNVDTVVGELHTANDIVQSGTYLKYGQTADSSIDVGIKPAGGSWSVSGSVHMGNSNSTAVQWNEGAQFGYKLRSGFLYKEYYYSYTPSSCGSPFYKTTADHWSLVPDGAEAPQSNDYNHNLDNACRYSSWPSNNGPNTSVLRDSNAFVHFDVGFSAFGFDAGAQSGASTYVQSHWKFGSSANHYLCGSDNDISHAHRIFAGFG